MKIFLSLFLGLLLFTFAGASSQVSAQNKKLTIILIRHAEKDVSEGADKIDPDLTAQGRTRAERLVEVVKKYKPNRIYSTNFKRTRLTVAPLAEKRKVPVEIYDHKKLAEFFNQLMQETKSRRILVVGHNTTTPALANMLIGQEKYKALDESVYNKMWIITLRKGKVKEQLIEY
jgi:2,3-bisphosphoglycerate-dependent phosphoglycerate mutase